MMANTGKHGCNNETSCPIGHCPSAEMQKVKVRGLANFSDLVINAQNCPNTQMCNKLLYDAQNETKVC